VKRFPLKNVDDIASAFRGMSPLEYEGFVVVDHRFHRVKIKHPEYQALHRVRGNGVMTYKRAVEIALAGRVDEVVSAYPEWREPLHGARAAINLTIELAGKDYKELKDIGDQKVFAEEAKKFPYSHILFGLRAGRLDTVEQGLKNMHIDHLMELLSDMLPRIDRELV
jgi:hypothetical protein